MASKNQQMASQSQADEKFEHGWKEVREKFPDDILLRSFGFVIVSRPKKGPILWKNKKGRIMNQASTKAYCRRHQMETV